jgi:hypothetical protein
LAGSILAGTCPILLDREEAMIAIELTTGRFDMLIDDGQIDDCVIAGPRQLFRAVQIREILHRRQQEITARAASRTISAEVKARQAARAERQVRQAAKRLQSLSTLHP